MKAAFFKYKTWMESLLLKEGKNMRETLEDSFKNSQRKTIEEFMSFKSQESQKNSQKVFDLEDELRQKDL